MEIFEKIVSKLEAINALQAIGLVVILFLASFFIIPVIAQFIVSGKLLKEGNWKVALVALLLGLYGVVLLLYF